MKKISKITIFVLFCVMLCVTSKYVYREQALINILDIPSELRAMRYISTHCADNNCTGKDYTERQACIKFDNSNQPLEMALFFNTSAYYLENEQSCFSTSGVCSEKYSANLRLKVTNTCPYPIAYIIKVLRDPILVTTNPEIVEDAENSQGLIFGFSGDDWEDIINPETITETHTCMEKSYVIPDIDTATIIKIIPSPAQSIHGQGINYPKDCGIVIDTGQDQYESSGARLEIVDEAPGKDSGAAVNVSAMSTEELICDGYQSESVGCRLSVNKFKDHGIKVGVDAYDDIYYSSEENKVRYDVVMYSPDNKIIEGVRECKNLIVGTDICEILPAQISFDDIVEGDYDLRINMTDKFGAIYEERSYRVQISSKIQLDVDMIDDSNLKGFSDGTGEIIIGKKRVGESLISIDPTAQEIKAKVTANNLGVENVEIFFLVGTKIIGQGTTDADGIVSWPLTSAYDYAEGRGIIGNITVKAQHYQYASGYSQVTIKSEIFAQCEAGMSLTESYLCPSNNQVDFCSDRTYGMMVVNSWNEPILKNTGVKIGVVKSDGFFKNFAPEDDSGLIQISLPPGSTKLNISANEYYINSQEVTLTSLTSDISPDDIIFFEGDGCDQSGCDLLPGVKDGPACVGGFLYVRINPDKLGCYPDDFTVKLWFGRDDAAEVSGVPMILGVCSKYAMTEHPITNELYCALPLTLEVGQQLINFCGLDPQNFKVPTLCHYEEGDSLRYGGQGQEQGVIYVMDNKANAPLRVGVSLEYGGKEIMFLDDVDHRLRIESDCVRGQAVCESGGWNSYMCLGCKHTTGLDFRRNTNMLVVNKQFNSKGEDFETPQGHVYHIFCPTEKIEQSQATSSTAQIVCSDGSLGGNRETHPMLVGRIMKCNGEDGSSGGAPDGYPDCDFRHEVLIHRGGTDAYVNNAGDASYKGDPFAFSNHDRCILEGQNYGGRVLYNKGINVDGKTCGTYVVWSGAGTTGDAPLNFNFDAFGLVPGTYGVYVDTVKRQCDSHGVDRYVCPDCGPCDANDGWWDDVQDLNKCDCQAHGDAMCYFGIYRDDPDYGHKTADGWIVDRAPWVFHIQRPSVSFSGLTEPGSVCSGGSFTFKYNADCTILHSNQPVKIFIDDESTLLYNLRPETITEPNFPGVDCVSPDEQSINHDLACFVNLEVLMNHYGRTLKEGVHKLIIQHDANGDGKIECNQVVCEEDEIRFRITPPILLVTTESEVSNICPDKEDKLIFTFDAQCIKQPKKLVFELPDKEFQLDNHCTITGNCGIKGSCKGSCEIPTSADFGPAKFLYQMIKNNDAYIGKFYDEDNVKVGQMSTFIWRSGDLKLLNVEYETAKSTAHSACASANIIKLTLRNEGDGVISLKGFADQLDYVINYDTDILAEEEWDLMKCKLVPFSGNPTKIDPDAYTMVKYYVSCNPWKIEIGNPFGNIFKFKVDYSDYCECTSLVDELRQEPTNNAFCQDASVGTGGGDQAEPVRSLFMEFIGIGSPCDPEDQGGQQIGYCFPQSEDKGVTCLEKIVSDPAPCTPGHCSSPIASCDENACCGELSCGCYGTCDAATQFCGANGCERQEDSFNCPQDCGAYDEPRLAAQGGYCGDGQCEPLLDIRCGQKYNENPNIYGAFLDAYQLDCCEKRDYICHIGDFNYCPASNRDECEGKPDDCCNALFVCGDRKCHFIAGENVYNCAEDCCGYDGVPNQEFCNDGICMYWETYPDHVGCPGPTRHNDGICDPDEKCGEINQNYKECCVFDGIDNCASLYTSEIYWCPSVDSSGNFNPDGACNPPLFDGNGNPMPGTLDPRYTVGECDIEWNENARSCYEDCAGITCGDGFCSPGDGENQETCAKDCIKSVNTDGGDTDVNINEECGDENTITINIDELGSKSINEAIQEQLQIASNYGITGQICIVIQDENGIDQQNVVISDNGEVIANETLNCNNNICTFQVQMEGVNSLQLNMDLYNDGGLVHSVDSWLNTSIADSGFDEVNTEPTDVAENADKLEYVVTCAETDTFSIDKCYIGRKVPGSDKVEKKLIYVMEGDSITRYYGFQLTNDLMTMNVKVDLLNRHLENKVGTKEFDLAQSGFARYMSVKTTGITTYYMDVTLEICEKTVPTNCLTKEDRITIFIFKRRHDGVEVGFDENGYLTYKNKEFLKQDVLDNEQFMEIMVNNPTDNNMTCEIKLKYEKRMVSCVNSGDEICSEVPGSKDNGMVTCSCWRKVNIAENEGGCHVDPHTSDLIKIPFSGPLVGDIVVESQYCLDAACSLRSQTVVNQVPISVGGFATQLSEECFYPLPTSNPDWLPEQSCQDLSKSPRVITTGPSQFAKIPVLVKNPTDQSMVVKILVKQGGETKKIEGNKRFTTLTDISPKSSKYKVLPVSGPIDFEVWVVAYACNMTNPSLKLKIDEEGHVENGKDCRVSLQIIPFKIKLTMSGFRRGNCRFDFECVSHNCIRSVGVCCQKGWFWSPLYGTCKDKVDFLEIGTKDIVLPVGSTSMLPLFLANPYASPIKVKILISGLATKFSGLNCDGKQNQMSCTYSLGVGKQSVVLMPVFGAVPGEQNLVIEKSCTMNGAPCEKQLPVDVIQIHVLTSTGGIVDIKTAPATAPIDTLVIFGLAVMYLKKRREDE